MMEKLRAYWKSITAVVASLVAAGGVIWGGGDLALKADDWKERAETSHVLAQTNEEVVKRILKYQENEIRAKQSREAEERRKLDYITKMCLTGKLCDPNECAKVKLEPKCE